ncbi:MAG: ribosome maturation factor RimP [Longimicrobiales bacterium]
MRVPEGLDQEVESRTEGLGFDVVQLTWAGSKARPILRLRIERQALDRPVSVDDCAKVSRALEQWLEEDGRLPERYVLEVSSPGVERPLVRNRDFERFRGHQVVVTGKRSIEDQGKRVEGELLGLDDVAGVGTVRLRLNGGDEVRIARDEIEGARLVYEWKK